MILLACLPLFSCARVGFLPFLAIRQTLLSSLLALMVLSSPLQIVQLFSLYLKHFSWIASTYYREIYKVSALLFEGLF